MATITDETGEGLYTISVDTGSATLDAKIAILNNRLTISEAATGGLQTEVLTASNNVNAASSNLNAAIDNYAASRTDANLTIVKEKTQLLADAGIVFGLAENKLNRNTVEIADTNSNIAYYSGFDLTETKDAWCVDYTLAATGEVATIEIPGEPVTVVLAPDCPAPVDATDGIVTARVAQDANQLYLNLAILPGWQKFSPTFRVGAITDLDQALDTCTVLLDDAESSAQDLDINQESTLYDVEIVYMTCNSAAFVVDDRVVVQFLSQDWEQPRVIGFESNPNPCSIPIVRYCYSNISPLPSYAERWIFTMPLSQQYFLDALRKIPQEPSETQPNYPVIVEVRPDGDANFVQLPFYRVISYNPGGPPPYWKDTQDASYQPIMWNADGVWSGNHAGRLLFDFWDTSTDYVDWTAFDYSTIDQMAYAASYNQTDSPVTFKLIADQFDAYAGIGGIFSNFSNDIMEIRIRTQPGFYFPENPTKTVAHFSIRRSTRQIYNAAEIDLIPEQVSGYYPTADVFEWTDYDFPE